MSHEETTYEVGGPVVAELMNTIGRAMALATSADLTAEAVAQIAIVAVTCHAVLNCGEEIRPALLGQVLAAHQTEHMVRMEMSPTTEIRQ